jgi:ribosomal protein L11 methylase PrmA
MARKSPNKVADLNIRSIIDEIALEVAEANVSEDDLSTAISDKTMEHITRLREEHAFSEEELDRIASAIVRGVLKRLNQIAESGGQIGNA